MAIGFFSDDDYSSPGEINLLQRDVVSRLPAEAQLRTAKAGKTLQNSRSLPAVNFNQYVV